MALQLGVCGGLQQQQCSQLATPTTTTLQPTLLGLHTAPSCRSTSRTSCISSARLGWATTVLKTTLPWQDGWLPQPPLLVSSVRLWLWPPQLLVRHSMTWRTTCMTAPGRRAFTAATNACTWAPPTQAGARPLGQASENMADALLWAGRVAGA